MSYELFEDLRDRTAALSDAAAVFDVKLIVGAGEQSEHLGVTLASSGFWRMFDAHPHIGRFFDAADDRKPLGPPVVVLGYGYWKRRFGGDRAVLGQVLRMGSRPYTIIGLAPAGFSGFDLEPVSAFTPITAGGADQWVRTIS